MHLHYSGVRNSLPSISWHSEANYSFLNTKEKHCFDLYAVLYALRMLPSYLGISSTLIPALMTTVQIWWHIPLNSPNVEKSEISWATSSINQPGNLFHGFCLILWNKKVGHSKAGWGSRSDLLTIKPRTCLQDGFQRPAHGLDCKYKCVFHRPWHQLKEWVM